VFSKKESIDNQSESLSRITWRRFKKNKLSMFGLIVIAFACMISILGYLITPDKTPNANNQKPELRIREPGFSINFLLVKRNAEVTETSFFERMLFGAVEPYASFTAFSHGFKGSDIIVEEYTGSTPNNGAKTSFNLADVLFALSPSTKPSYDSIRNTITFLELGKSVPVTLPIADMQASVLKENLTRKSYFLGTDILGRDLLSRLLIGTRISLSVGLISVIISIFIGIFLGSLAGYFRGKVDSAIMWFINVVWSIPTILLVIAITLVLGKGITQVFIAVGLTMWVEVARLVRGQILSIREKEFVEAGRALGFSNARIIFRHILPNVMGPVVVAAAGNFAAAILTEAGLSFLGIGTQPPMPSWGEMTNAHHGYILMDKAYLAFIPGIAIMILVLSFMLVGNGLRDAMDTRSTDDKPLLNV
jgi:peptide/nickel transport system permease protein